MRIKHLIEYFVFEIVALIVQWLPLKTVQAVGARVGEFFFSVVGYRKETTMENLRNAYPGRSKSDLEKIACAAFRSIGTSLFEVLWFPRMNADFVRGFCKVENPEVLLQAKSRGKGIIILTAHFGNWELGGSSIVATTGIPILMIVKTQANRFIDRKINDWRTRLGNKVIPMEFSVRASYRTLREGNLIGIAADQAATASSLQVDFFGRPVPTFEGPAVLSLKTGAPIFLAFAVRQQDGTYRIRFEDLSRDDLKEFNEHNVAELTRLHVSRTESIIRQYPDQWLWMHKRWKHVPERGPDASTHAGRQA